MSKRGIRVEEYSSISSSGDEGEAYLERKQRLRAARSNRKSPKRERKEGIGLDEVLQKTGGYVGEIGGTRDLVEEGKHLEEELFAAAKARAAGRAVRHDILDLSSDDGEQRSTWPRTKNHSRGKRVSSGEESDASDGPNMSRTAFEKKDALDRSRRREVSRIADKAYETFNAMDLDRDGFLSRKEFDRAIRTGTALSPASQSRRSAASGRSFSKGQIRGLTSSDDEEE